MFKRGYTTTTHRGGKQIGRMLHLGLEVRLFRGNILLPGKVHEVGFESSQF